MKKIFFIVSAAGLFLFLVSFVGSQNKPWDIPAKYLAMENPYSADDDCLDTGKDLYNRHCKSCHGSKGYGDGRKAAEIDTEMPDITTDEFKAQKPGAKYYQSFIGRDDMPNYEKKIPNEEDRWCIINYLDNL